MLGIVYVLGAIAVWTLFATKPDPALTVPLQAAHIAIAFALSALSLRFLTLKRPWQVATAWGSLLLSALILYIAVRTTANELPNYWPIGPGGYPALAFVATLWWAPVIAYSTCSYVLWRCLQRSSSNGS